MCFSHWTSWFMASMPLGVGYWPSISKHTLWKCEMQQTSKKQHVFYLQDWHQLIQTSFDATVHVQLLQTLEDYTDVELDAKNERLGLENQLWAWDAHATRLLVVCPSNMHFFFHMYIYIYIHTVYYIILYSIYCIICVYNYIIYNYDCYYFTFYAHLAAWNNRVPW